MKGYREAIPPEVWYLASGKSPIAFGIKSMQVNRLVPDLMIDYRIGSDRPFAWISYNFHKTYPSVIWGLKLLMADELFDVPQAGLTAVSLHDAFSWAYAHFVLEDEMSVLMENAGVTTDLTRQVLHYATAVA